jgi:hypothetical protein
MENEEIIAGIRHQMIDCHNLHKILISSSFLLSTKPAFPLPPLSIYSISPYTAFFQDFVHISRFLHTCCLSLQFQPSKCDHHWQDITF